MDTNFVVFLAETFFTYDVNIVTVVISICNTVCDVEMAEK